MLTTIMTVNRWAEGWLSIMGAVLWQSVLLIVLAALIAWCLRRSSPVVRYWLWQIVAIKLLLMPFWSLAVPVPTWNSGLPEQSATIQPAVNRGVEPDRMMYRKPISTEDSSTAPAPQAASTWKNFTAVSWQAWLLLIWFIVVLWQLVRLLLQRVRLVRLFRRAVPADAELAGLVTELAGQIGLRRVPTTVSVAGDCPLFVCGLWRPRLVLPSRLMDCLGSAERRQVILHELGHIKRHDLAWGWPMEIARMVYFFNPLVYWAAYRLRLERELACDQLAMVRSGHSAAEYAQTLVQVVSHASEPAAAQAAAIAAGLAGSERMKDEKVVTGRWTLCV